VCGIAGIVASYPCEAILRSVVGAQAHRGPDDRGLAELRIGDSVVSLGSTRLAVIDRTAGGKMPMEDKRTGNYIVFNGEIYNYRELRRNLETKGVEFRTATDTEVVLLGYGVYGEGILDKLRGMFAFAIADPKNEELLLARDRLGEKPLYYYGDGNIFLFGSEVRALLSSGLIPRRLQPDALGVFLFNGFLVSPYTPVRGVRSLLPGHSMRISVGCCRIGARALNCYWRPGAASPGVRESEEGLASMFKEALRLRLQSDAELGTFLSGGMDSSTIVAVSAALGRRLKSVSLGIDHAEYDESKYARSVATRFQTVHTAARVSKTEFASLATGAISAQDQPSFDGVNTYCVARAAREAGLTVALSGLGADELFGGYPFFKTVPWLARLIAMFPRVPRCLETAWSNLAGARVSAPWKLLDGLTSARASRVAPLLIAYQTVQMLFPRLVRAKLLSPEAPEESLRMCVGLPPEFLSFLIKDAEVAREENLLSLCALRIFLGERCLRDTDMMAMAVSLEVRAAFTDHEFVEYALAFPPSKRCRKPPSKEFQRSVFSTYLGDDYSRRRKQGFIIPFETWLRETDCLRFLQGVLENERLLRDVGLSPEPVAGMLAQFQAGNGVSWNRLWALFAWAAWCQRNRVTL
jgi:asparagine synthase (glutamine-hydrolysing)